MKRTTKLQLSASIAALSAFSMVVAAGTVVSWASATNGSWSDSNNWTPMMIPGISDDAILGLQGSYVVSINSMESAKSLSITNPDATVEINSAHALSLLGNLTNDGTILINPVSGGSLTTLHFDTDATISGMGSVKLNGFGPRARITSVAGGVVTNQSPHTIEGFGQIEAGILNEGLIRANVINNELSLRTNAMENFNVMEAVDGGVLNISGITLSNNLGEVRATGPDAEVRLTGSTIIGGQLYSDLGGQITVTNASTLDGVLSDADMSVNNSHVLNIQNSITNNGEILVNPTSGDSESALKFLDSSNLDGFGAVSLNGFGVRASLQADEGVFVTNMTDHTIRGKGQIEAELINRGLVSADIVAQELALMSFPKMNVATMQAVNGAILNILGTTITQFDMYAGGNEVGVNGIILADGIDSTIQIAGSMIVGGSVETYNDANVVITCATTFDNVAFSGIMRILNSHRLILREGTANFGTILVNPAAGEGVTFIEWDEEMTLEGEGVISLLASGARSQLNAADGVEFGELGAGQRLEGIGEIALNLINSGELAPGLSVGMMSATAPVLLSPTSVFEAEIAPSSADLFRSVSTVELGGQLDVEFIDGFEPEGFWGRTIVEASSITQAFEVANFPPAPIGLESKIYNTGTELIIGQTCSLDFNIDGELNFFDVSIFLDAFQNRNPIADMNSDGRFNFFDVSAFLVELENGCDVPK